jgi:hypothetical protein
MTTITITQTFTSKTRNGGGGGGAIPPSNTVAPLLSGTPTVGQTLSCSTGTWLGTLPITYTYQWRRGVSNILGATSSTYTLVQADASFAVTCIVTATNAAGSADSTSNSLTIFDADAQAFITAAGITDNTQKTAINTLVVSMKGYGIWTKMKAIYPFVGGTATTHKFNLKNPLDTNAAFRLVFNGGWTHSSNGALPNGTNGYAETFLVPNSNLTVNSAHLSYYSRTQISAIVAIDMGSSTSAGTNDMSLYHHYGASLNVKGGIFYTYPTEAIAYNGANSTNTLGFQIVTRTAVNVLALHFNSVKLSTNTNNRLNTLPITSTVIGANKQGSAIGQFSPRQCAFASIGDGLTDTDAGNLYTAVQAFNTTLARQV